MKKTIYLAAAEKISGELPLAQTGFGFTDGGSFLAPQPQTEVLVLDDRFSPAAEGLAEAVSFFRALPEIRLLCDLERPPSAGFRELLSALDAKRLILPPQYADLPHAAVFLPPYRPTLPYRDWLARQRRRYGALVLDLQPILCRAAPGTPLRALPPDDREDGFHFSDALCCGCRATIRCGRVEFSFRDDPDTFRRRAELADCPCVVPAEEYRRLNGGMMK